MVKHAHTRLSFTLGNSNHDQTCSYTTIIYTRQQQPWSNMLIHDCHTRQQQPWSIMSYPTVIYTRQQQPWSNMLIRDRHLKKVTSTMVKHAHTRLSFTQGNSNRGQTCSYTPVFYTRQQQPWSNMFLHQCHLH